MYNDFREYSDYLMHYGVPGMKWKHHHYVVDPPRKIQSSKSDSSIGEKRASIKQNYYDELDRTQHNNKQSSSRPVRKRYESLKNDTSEDSMFDRNNASNSHTTAKPNARVSRDYVSEYTYNTTGRSDNESVGRMHKRFQKNGDANPNANLSSRRSRGLMTTLGVNHGGHHFSGDNSQEHSRDYDDHHLTSRIVKSQRKRRR